ncbi:hypothetical protein RB195_013655 [Necator americanus]|uniref:SKA complex subunit 1 n=1 Tax=Necator americanus TaxID=51031 RepID=A0ABR1DWL2_NECAM
MSDHIVLPISEEHVEPITNRKNEIVSHVESILPPAKIEKITHRFNEKLAHLQQLIRDCNLLNAELREMSPLEQVFLGVGDVIRNENISVEYPRSASAEITAKSTCLEAEVAGAAPINTTQPNPPSGACEEPKAISGNIIRTVSETEFEEIPRYMRGRMTRAELNEIVVKLDEFLMQKRRLLNAPFKKLSIKDKDQVGKWKEQETPATANKLFCQEADVKPELTDRGRVLFRSVIPCLRHVRRIREPIMSKAFSLLLFSLSCSLGIMTDEKYEIKRILAERKADGKQDKMEYLVDWEPTWVFDSDMDAGLLDDFHYSVVVLGPIHTPENIQKKSIKDMDIVIQRESKRDNEKDGVILELMPYEQVKKLYPDELFAYIETTFSLPEDMCQPYEKEDNKKKPKKKSTNNVKKKSAK